MIKPLQPLFAATIIVASVLPVTSQAQETEKVPSAVPTKEEPKVKPYAHKNSKGSTYYLFSREQKVRNSDKVFTMYFFAKDPENKKGTPVAKVPEDREVSETKTGLLVLKKKVKK